MRQNLLKFEYHQLTAQGAGGWEDTKQQEMKTLIQSSPAARNCSILLHARKLGSFLTDSSFRAGKGGADRSSCKHSSQNVHQVTRLRLQQLAVVVLQGPTTSYKHCTSPLLPSLALAVAALLKALDSSIQ